MLMKDEQKVENYLMNIGYHRLSAYIYPFYQSPKNNLTLKEDTTFEQVLTLYRFDKKLRILLFNEIEKIEVAIRSVLANVGCQKLNDRYWITKPEYFAIADKFNQTLAVIEKELASSKEDYIVNFRHNHVESYPPAWMITEVLSFGNLNYIYSNIASNKLMKLIADYFGLKPQVFTSWLTVLANLRNMCCHHARVWNRDFMLTPAEPRENFKSLDRHNKDRQEKGFLPLVHYKIFPHQCFSKQQIQFKDNNPPGQVPICGHSCNGIL